MQKNSDESLILERLDQILRVLAIQVGAELSMTERVRLLKTAGLANQTIADVLNTSAATVRTLSARTSKTQKALGR